MLIFLMRELSKAKCQELHKQTPKVILNINKNQAAVLLNFIPVLPGFYFIFVKSLGLRKYKQR